MLRFFKTAFWLMPTRVVLVWCWRAAQLTDLICGPMAMMPDTCRKGFIVDDQKNLLVAAGPDSLAWMLATMEHEIVAGESGYHEVSGEDFGL
jgi:hypothetical protein